MGDPHKMVILDTLLKVMKEDNLLDNTLKQGEALVNGLKALQVNH